MSVWITNRLFSTLSTFWFRPVILKRKKQSSKPTNCNGDFWHKLVLRKRKLPRSIHHRWKIQYLLALNSFYCCCLCCLYLFYLVVVFCRDHLCLVDLHHLFHLLLPTQISQYIVSTRKTKNGNCQIRIMREQFSWNQTHFCAITTLRKSLLQCPLHWILYIKTSARAVSVSTATSKMLQMA